jgi:aminopeptidase YwaD
MKSIVPVALVSLAGAIAFGPSAAGKPATRGEPVCAECVVSTMKVLAGEDLHGRRCGTADENAAAHYLADRLKSEGVQGGLPGGEYLQKVDLRTETYARAPTLTVTPKQGSGLTLTHGAEFGVRRTPPELSGDLVRLTSTAAAAEQVRGKVVLVDVADRGAANAALKAGAAGVIVAADKLVLEHWAELATRPPAPIQIVGVPTDPTLAGAYVYVTPAAFERLKGLVGAQVRLAAPRGEPVLQTTYNVVGVRHGSAADADKRVILLTAHYDHLGVRDGVTYHGANDDASGSAAVVEFARMIAKGPAPKTTAYFAMFGCEETGGQGAQAFLAHPPLPLTSIAANLEFEMIGNDDPKNPGSLMLTGWERSNLGPTLKAHGALIGPDPFPEQNFFERSDNYQLALKGVVAQTVSAWAVTTTYHKPTDDLAHIDFGMMDRTIGSLADPIRWLLNSNFRPEWNPGQKPSAS